MRIRFTVGLHASAIGDQSMPDEAGPLEAPLAAVFVLGSHIFDAKGRLIL
jgi:hypothetical protein